MTFVPTPNYVIDGDFTVVYDVQDFKTLRDGAFCRPIHINYIPQHVLDKPTHKSFNPDTDIYCYTIFGIVALPINRLRQV